MSVSILIPAIAGLATAGLINYLADTLPHDLRLGRPACADPSCRAAFSWKEYFLLRPCPRCGRHSRIRTIAVYLLALAAAIYLWFHPPARLGFTLGGLTLAYLGLVALIDLEHHLILLPLSLAGLLIAGGAGLLMHGWAETLLGGLAGFVILYVLYLFGKLFTRLRARKLGQDPRQTEEALASGDVTLATLLGLFLGWPLIWFGLLLGMLLAGLVSLVVLLQAVARKRYKEQALMLFIPLGPAFISGAVFLVYFPNWIVRVLP